MTDAVRALVCPSCGGTVEIRAAGYSVSVACRHCGSLLDVSRPDVALIAAQKASAASFAIELGTRGTLFDQEWEVIGAQRRKDPFCTWQEFLLFNPYIGYRWLVAAEGEWQFGTPLLDHPEEDGGMVTWRGEHFTRQDDPQDATTTGVMGEFYWRVARGDKVECTAFERGDVVLSSEQSAGERNWTHLLPLDADIVTKTFRVDLRRLPRRPRRSPVLGFRSEPGMRRDDLPRMFGLAGIVVALALVMMAALAGPTRTTSDRLDVPVGGSKEGIKIGTIEVSRPWQFVTVQADTNDFNNRWVDLDYSLVDRKSQQSIDAYGLVEFYRGVDSDGPWTEGDHHTTTLFGHVPRGTYDLYVDASAHGWPSDPTPDTWSRQENVSLWIQASTGSYPWGNWWTLVVAAFAFPLLAWWWRREQGD